MKEIIITTPIDEAVDKAIYFIHQKGFKIFADINQQKEAENVGLTIPKTRLLIFGNPKVGTLLMQENDWITFELPSKVLFIQDKDQTKMIYRDPKNFIGCDQLSSKGKEILEKMHEMYLEMHQAIKT